MASVGGYREIIDLPGRTFLVGDLHGCLEELNVLLDHLTGVEKLNKDDTIVFIGDYIDRGPDGRGVVQRLLDFEKQYPRALFLKGNHEDMLLSYLAGGPHKDIYLPNGGIDTLFSYGLQRGSTAEELVSAMPSDHRDFFERLHRYIVTPRFVFVHAGLDPLRALQQQADEYLFWIRDEFIRNIHHFGKVVVFGHTPFQDVLFHLPYKIGIDTGAVYHNKLSCIEVRDGRILQVKRGSLSVAVSNFPVPVPPTAQNI